MSNPLEPYDGEIFSCVVIDGTNVLHVTRKELSLQRLLSTQLEVEKLGWPTLLAMKEDTYGIATSKKSSLNDDEKKKLKELRKMGKMSLITIEDGEPKGIDDLYFIKTAIDHDGWLLSKDRFRDHVKDLLEKRHFGIANEINKRYIRLKWVGDKPIFELPMNTSSLEDTKEIENFELLKEAVHLYNHITATIISEEGSNQQVDLPLRVPLGRKFFSEKLTESEKHLTDGISRSHFRLDSSSSKQWITDLNSKNGTFMDAVKIPPSFAQVITKEVPVEIGIGRIKLLFNSNEETSSEPVITIESKD